MVVWQSGKGTMERQCRGVRFGFFFGPFACVSFSHSIPVDSLMCPIPPIRPPPKILLQEQAAMTEEEDKKDNEDVDEDDNYRSNLTRLR